jgi:hypothetical protein
MRILSIDLETYSSVVDVISAILFTGFILPAHKISPFPDEKRA